MNPTTTSSIRLQAWALVNFADAVVLWKGTYEYTDAGLWFSNSVTSAKI